MQFTITPEVSGCFAFFFPLKLLADFCTKRNLHYFKLVCIAAHIYWPEQSVVFLDSDFNIFLLWL